MACATSFRESGKWRHSWYAMVGMNDEKHFSVTSPKKNVEGRMSSLRQESAMYWATSEVPAAPWTHIIRVDVVCSIIISVICFPMSSCGPFEHLGI